MLREPAHIAGVLKSAYVLATPHCLKWRCDPQQTGTSNDPVSISLRQSIGSNDALRTGSYSKTLTFTLSTTTP